MTSKVKPLYQVLSNYDAFNNLLKTFINSEDTRLKPLNLINAYFLKHKNLSMIETDSFFVLDENQQIESTEYLLGLNVSDQTTLISNYLVYPASRTYFFKDFFSSFSPLIGHCLYDCLNYLNLIKGVGLGKGYATLVQIPVDGISMEMYFNFITGYNYDIFYTAIEDLKLGKKTPKLISALNYNTLVHHEISYYQNLINDLNAVILNKDSEIAKLQQDTFIKSQLTWR